MSAKRLQHSIEYGAVRGAMALAGHLPRTAALRIGGALGATAFDAFRLRRAVSVDNIVRALGVSESEATAIARRAYRNMGRSLLEFAAFSHWTHAAVLDLVTPEHYDHLEAALAMKRGVVFVTGHYGNWELLGAHMSASGFPIDFLVGEQTNTRVDDAMNHLRRREGIGIITRTMSLRKVSRALAENRVVCMLADQDARRHGVMVDFLGRPASTVRGPALFAIRRQCPIVTGFIRREGNRHRAVLNPPLLARELPEDEAILDLTQRHADALADQIRARPDEYFWPHRRWKTTSL